MAQTRSWHPSEAEIQRMVAEMRPLLAELARRDRERCQGDCIRRCDGHKLRS